MNVKMFNICRYNKVINKFNYKLNYGFFTAPEPQHVHKDHENFFIENKINASTKPSCKECKYFMNEKCKLFSFVPDYNKYYEYVSVLEARDNELLCGPDGIYFKKI